MTRYYGGTIHSDREDVHHTRTECSGYAAIPPEEAIQGTGGKPLCEECADLTPLQPPPRRSFGQARE